MQNCTSCRTFQDMVLLHLFSPWALSQPNLRVVSTMATSTSLLESHIQFDAQRPATCNFTCSSRGLTAHSAGFAWLSRLGAFSSTSILWMSLFHKLWRTVSRKLELSEFLRGFVCEQSVDISVPHVDVQDIMPPPEIQQMRESRSWLWIPQCLRTRRKSWKRVSS